MTTTPDSPIAHADTIQGWMNADELLWIFETGRMFSGGSVVELGCWKGRSLSAWAHGMRTGNLYAIDNMSGRHSWDAPADPDSQAKALSETIEDLLWMQPELNVVQMQTESADAAQMWMGSAIDCVFIDADHRTDHVTADILAWRDIVRPRGMICGHDYNAPGLREVVDHLLGHVENPTGSIWYHVKTDDEYADA